jgi:hypothetical protein
MPSDTTQEKEMPILIVLAAFYTISFSLSYAALVVPIDQKVQYLN